MRDDLTMTKKEIFNELEKLGVKEVNVEFSGGGDSGGVDAIEVEFVDGHSESWEEYYHRMEWNQEKGYHKIGNSTSNELLRAALCEPIYNKYRSFAGEYSVSGRVTWDVENESCKMHAQESVESWEDIEEDFSDE